MKGYFCHTSAHDAVDCKKDLLQQTIFLGIEITSLNLLINPLKYCELT